MVEGQGWEGIYFLDGKLQFLCKNRKTYLQKQKNWGKPVQRNVLVWKDGWLLKPASKRTKGRKCKLNKQVSDKKYYFFFYNVPPCNPKPRLLTALLAPAELLSCRWLLCLAAWEKESYLEVPSYSPISGLPLTSWMSVIKFLQ